MTSAVLGATWQYHNLVRARWHHHHGYITSTRNGKRSVVWASDSVLSPWLPATSASRGTAVASVCRK